MTTLKWVKKQLEENSVEPLCLKMDWKEIDKLFYNAIKMEKEQMCNMFINGCWEVTPKNMPVKENDYEDNAEIHYNKISNTENKIHHYLQNYENNNNTKIKLIETDSNFLENTSNKILINGEEWYQPLWYKKISDGIFAEYHFEELPDFIKNQIK